MAYTSDREKAYRLAYKHRADVCSGPDEVTAHLTGGRTWEHSGTDMLIASRESDETMDEVWSDLLKQMELGLSSEYD